MSKKEKIESVEFENETLPITEYKQKLNVWQKLVAVRKTIGYIKKGAQGYGYKYAKESDVLLAMSEEMNNQGLVLEQVAVSCENVAVAFKGKEVPGLKIHFEYIITDSDNPSNQIVRSQFIQQHGSDAQTIGSMMTYGMKYFLFKTFNIAMDEYDIDAMDKEKIDYAPVQKQNQNQPVSSEKITPDQVKKLREMVEKSKSEKAFLQWIFQEYNAARIEDIKKIHLDAIVYKLQLKLQELNAYESN